MRDLLLEKSVKNPRLSAVKVSAEFYEKFSTSISQVVRETGLHERSAPGRFC